MDRLYRHVKTGEIKPLPPKVYQAVKKNWVPVNDIEVKTVKITPEPTEPVTPAPVGVFIPASDPIQETVNLTEYQAVSEGLAEVTIETHESLQATYEALAGKKPDGRWSEKKLAEKIQELKETK